MFPIPHGKIQVPPGGDGHQGDVVNLGAMTTHGPHEFPTITTRDLPIHLTKSETRGPMTKGDQKRENGERWGGMGTLHGYQFPHLSVEQEVGQRVSCAEIHPERGGGGKLTFRQGLSVKSWQARGALSRDLTSRYPRLGFSPLN